MMRFSFARVSANRLSIRPIPGLPKRSIERNGVGNRDVPRMSDGRGSPVRATITLEGIMRKRETNDE
jgi:hypothetical protein